MTEDNLHKLWKKSTEIAKTGIDAGKSGLEKAKPHVIRAGDTSLQATKKAAIKTSDLVSTGVHRVMGSAEYKVKAEDVNRRLMEALRALEDSIKRRDRDIADLKAYVAALEAQLKERSGGQ
jgi:hypothetical protein